MGKDRKGKAHWQENGHYDLYRGVRKPMPKPSQRHADDDEDDFDPNKYRGIDVNNLDELENDT